MRLTTMLAAGLLGCAKATHAPPPPVEERLQQAGHALGRADYAAAHRDLSWILSHCPATEAGDRALLGLLAIELDPRNALRRPEIATELVTARLRAGGDTWAVQAAETLYLLMLELGLAPAVAPAAAPTRHGAPQAIGLAPEGFALSPPGGGGGALSCGPATAGDRRRPPELPGVSLSAKLTATEGERMQLVNRVAALERELAELRRTLAQREAALDHLEQELARIRRTLRP